MNHFAIAKKHDGTFEFIEKSKEEMQVVLDKFSNEGSEEYREIRVYAYSVCLKKRSFKKPDAKVEEAKVEEAKAEVKPDAKAEDAKAEVKPEAKVEEAKAEVKPEAKKK